MPEPAVAVAVPVRDGAQWLEGVLGAVRAQRGVGKIDLVVCDSGSRDGSVEIARRHGARVDVLPAGSFSHGATRNRLMELARGDAVAFLTQDAEPAGPDWLASLLAGLDAADDVGLAYGPYRPRPGASLPVAHDLVGWFEALSPDGEVRVDRAGPGVPPRSAHPAAFFTSANGIVARRAWTRIPFPDVPYAEDRLLGTRMLEAGFAKAYVPHAAVLHSHDYTSAELFRRAFDEARALRELYGQREPLRPDRMAREIARGVRGDLAWRGAPGGPATSLAFHAVRAAGRGLGSRAQRLPAPARRALSLEGRS
jgi:glycosyltransferase involved in cell wall biosynthesis